MRNLAETIFSKIFKFKDILYKSMESIDDEQVSFYIDVFTSMIGNNIDELIEQKRFDFFQILVDLTKKCPANKITIITEFFYYLNKALCDDDKYGKDFAMNNFKNIFIQLILNFICLTKFDDEIFEKLNISKNKT